MPKLPTADSLPQTAPQVTMMDGSYTPRQIASPFGQLDRAGEELLAKAKLEKEKQDRYAADKAKVDFLRAESELRMKYETDPDFKTAPDRMGAELHSTRSKLLSGLAGDSAKDFDLWSQQQAIQAYESQNNDRLTKYRAEELGIYSTNNDFLESRAAQQKYSGDLAGFEKTMQQINTQDEHIAAISPEARMKVAAARAGGRAASIGKIIGEISPASSWEEWLKNDTKKQGYPPQPAPFVNRDSAIDFVIDELEKNPTPIPDGNGRSRWGINDAANPEVNVDSLTREQAKQIYSKKYWDAMNIDALPNEMKMIVFDAAVNQGVGFAKEALSKSGNDPVAFSELRRQRYNQIGGKNLPGWLNRLDRVNDLIGVSVNDKSTGVFEIDAWKKSDPIGFRRFGEAKIAESNKQYALAKSNFEVEIASATEDANKLAEINNRIAASDLPQLIKNDLAIKVLSVGKSAREKQASVSRGSLFWTGQNTNFNPEDEQDKKDANIAYEAIESSEAFKNADPVVRRVMVSEMISNVGFVPDHVKGNIISASRSKNAATVVEAADLLDRITLDNPTIINALGPTEQLARLKMVNSYVDIGFKPEEAVRLADEKLDPKNRATVEAIKDEMTALEKKDSGFIANQADDIFSSWVPFTTPEITIPERDAMRANYRQYFESAYSITRDINVSHEMASTKIRANFFPSEVNGEKQVMRYAPELAYPSRNGEYGWMRQQMADKAQEYLKDIPNAPDRKFIEENVRIMFNKRTPRTFAEGRPEYNLVLIQDGIPKTVGTFFFDVAKRNQWFIDKAKEKEGSLFGVFK